MCLATAANKKSCLRVNKCFHRGKNLADKLKLSTAKSTFGDFAQKKYGR
jgi:hypothetical protein